jgi:GT2 family glycosyltransferase
MMNGKLAIAIVNYRTADLTIGCLQSLAGDVPSLPGVKVVVCDNDSQDGSTERISQAIEREGWSRWARIVPLPRNGGFAFGTNAAIEPLLRSPQPPDYFVLLNPDTRIRSGAIQALLAFADQHPDVGIVGSRLEDPDGMAQRSAFRFHTILSELTNQLHLGLLVRLLARWVQLPPVSEQPLRADWVAGASMLVRRQVFDAVGLLDEGYFLYFEEVDFCLRAARAGWSCWYAPQSRVIHLVGRSTGVTNSRTTTRDRLPQYWLDSRRRYFLKNHGPLYTTVLDCVCFIAYLIWQVRRRIQGTPETPPVAYFEDYVRNSVFVRGFKP